jgi:hypothetical protein
MYSGTTLHNKSGNLVGAHQKFDRVARKFVGELRPEVGFPTTKQILHFEGNNGPDGIKRKSPGVDEPWHYWDPTDQDDTVLLEIIHNHYEQLVAGLAGDAIEKSAFEAAWLAHAIVDGLTPAHHYPYEKKLIELRGEGIETRTSFKDKVVIKGDTRREMLRKNWKMWGAKGLLLSHATFEWGVSSTVRTLKLKSGLPSEGDIKHAKNIGYEAYLKEIALGIYELNMYERFLRRGWSMKIAKEIKQVLGPQIVHAITVLWVLALDESGQQ